MQELFFKYQILIFRTIGTFMLLIGFVVFFWTTPKDALTENEIAARNVARMEAKVSNFVGNKEVKPKGSPFLKVYKQAQAKQLRYITIAVMILGFCFLLYSFIRKQQS